jgi:hypothetical protein
MIYFPNRVPIWVAVKVKLKSSPEDIWNVLIDNPGWVHWYQGIALNFLQRYVAHKSRVVGSM